MEEGTQVLLAEDQESQGRWPGLETAAAACGDLCALGQPWAQDTVRARGPSAPSQGGQMGSLGLARPHRVSGRWWRTEAKPNGGSA